MLYTVVPLDVVFAAEPPKTEEEQRGTVRLIWQVEGGERKLMRVVSTDPKDYLKYKL